MTLHAVMFVGAIVELDWGRIEERHPFSRDCIWFNAFVVEMHALTLIMYALSKSPGT